MKRGAWRSYLPRNGRCKDLELNMELIWIPQYVSLVPTKVTPTPKSSSITYAVLEQTD